MDFFLHQLICKISRYLGRILYIPGGFLAGFLNHQLYQNPTIPMFSSYDSRNHGFNPETLPSTSSPLEHFGPTEFSPECSKILPIKKENMCQRLRTGLNI